MTVVTDLHDLIELKGQAAGGVPGLPAKMLPIYKQNVSQYLSLMQITVESV